RAPPVCSPGIAQIELPNTLYSLYATPLRHHDRHRQRAPEGRAPPVCSPGIAQIELPNTLYSLYATPLRHHDRH
ncbi:hypothetical protein CTI14_70740, partial [Methylobacterium radiotolerans]